MWARNTENGLEIVHVDPNGKWADGIPFFPVPEDKQRWIDSQWREEGGDFLPPSEEYFINQRGKPVRTQRDRLLADSDWMVIRHRDQVEGGVTPSLPPEKYAELLAYREALRNITSQSGFPDTIEWPAFTI